MPPSDGVDEVAAAAVSDDDGSQKNNCHIMSSLPDRQKSKQNTPEKIQFKWSN